VGPAGHGGTLLPWLARRRTTTRRRTSGRRTRFRRCRRERRPACIGRTRLWLRYARSRAARTRRAPPPRIGLVPLFNPPSPGHHPIIAGGSAFLIAGFAGMIALATTAPPHPFCVWWFDVLLVISALFT